ncbi:ABC transporter ATP-binding protein [Bdellovibrio svalbardensis]|uniref:ABC transporter ATP-binding protein n=1 Tax=Bdellovibrio svalbardensis TaxID=2972972 RepID=A0ABT6DIT7_9BACT|nr:ABC transporter ATP-binding protein [Bdellovibrio svalbardensis]MDG0816703.1 ABC transporter ATP-binding protein [Bdellovibrio svalbardensis]
MISVEVKDLSVKYGDFYAVRNLSFAVERGDIFGFLGANGAGKTTTIRVLCGLILPTEGAAFVGGVNVQEEPFAVKQKVGYMSQKFTLYDDMTVDENLAFTASLRKLEKGQFQNQKEMLLSFIHFNQSRSLMVRDLPGGVKQQVSLVASLLHDPEVVFLDEPTAGVSPAYRQRFWELIQQLAAAGKTVFVTTHYMDEAERCNRIALMRAGELIALDSPENLKKNSFPKKKPQEVHLEDVFIAVVEGGSE